MTKAGRKKIGSNPFGLVYRTPKVGQSSLDAELLPIVSTEPELRDAETPFRRLTRAVKAGTATPEMASDYSKAGGISFREVHGTFGTGKKVRRGASKAHEKLYGTSEEKRARWDKYQRLVNEVHPTFLWVAEAG